MFVVNCWCTLSVRHKKWVDEWLTTANRSTTFSCQKTWICWLQRPKISLQRCTEMMYFALTLSGFSLRYTQTHVAEQLLQLPTKHCTVTLTLLILFSPPTFPDTHCLCIAKMQCPVYNRCKMQILLITVKSLFDVGGIMNFLSTGLVRSIKFSTLMICQAMRCI